MDRWEADRGPSGEDLVTDSVGLPPSELLLIFVAQHL